MALESAKTNHMKYEKHVYGRNQWEWGSIHTMVIIDLLIVEDEQVNILVYRRERQEKVICVLAVFCNGCWKMLNEVQMKVNTYTYIQTMK